MKLKQASKTLEKASNLFESSGDQTSADGLIAFANLLSAQKDSSVLGWTKKIEEARRVRQLQLKHET